MNKQCQNRKTTFEITEEDLRFYERIQVSAPTWCPECGFRRRILFRNELNLYKRPCDLCGKDIISTYTIESTFPVYCNNCWFSDNWDPLVYGVKPDFSVPFLQQFYHLLQRAPRPALSQMKNLNSEYTNFSAENKNCYLLASALQCENCAYGARIFYSRDCFDCLDISHCEQCYQCLRCDRSSRCSYCGHGEGLVDCHYCFDCRGLTNCFGCVGLRNQSYCWFNVPLGKEEYLKRLTEIQHNSSSFESFFVEYCKLLLSVPRRYAYILKSSRSTGDNIVNCKGCQNCFFIREVVDSKNIFIASNLKDSMEVSYDDDSELSYEIMSGERDHRFMLGTNCWYSSDIQYSNLCFDSSFLFGCTT